MLSIYARRGLDSALWFRMLSVCHGLLYFLLRISVGSHSMTRDGYQFIDVLVPQGLCQLAVFHRRSSDFSPVFLCAPCWVSVHSLLTKAMLMLFFPPESACSHIMFEKLYPL